MPNMLVTEDIQAIMDAVDDIEWPDDLSVTVRYNEAEPTDKRPLVIILDFGLTPEYALQNTPVAENGGYIIRTVTEDTDGKAAATIAAAIHGAITIALQGVKIDIAIGFKTLNLRRGPRELGHWENISADERYWHSGFKWFGTFASNT